MFLVSAAFVAPALAQEAPPRNLLIELSPPALSVPIESRRGDDIMDRPAPPRTDPLREPFHVYVSVGDPRCLPGEDGFGPGPMGRGYPRRSH